MKEKWVSFRSWLGLLGMWWLVLMACNLPLSEPPAPLLPPTIGSPAQRQEIPSDLPQPTATPINLSITPEATSGGVPIVTPSVTPISVLTSTPLVTPVAIVTADATDALLPLTLTYIIRWRLDETDKRFAWAAVTLMPQGGDGNYTLYRDGKPTKGAIFEYRWGSCKDNPGTFRVESGDGQSSEINYFEKAPCP